MEQIQIDHKAYQKKIRHWSTNGLLYTIQDCKAVIAANPSGHKAGYYADEINYCSMELVKRQNKH